jgi:hypothetical protein
LEPFVIGLNVLRLTESQLFQIAETSGGQGSAFYLIKGGKKQTGENGNNGNDNKQFDESEFSRFIVDAHCTISFCFGC